MYQGGLCVKVYSQIMIRCLSVLLQDAHIIFHRFSMLSTDHKVSGDRTAYTDAFNGFFLSFYTLK